MQFVNMSTSGSRTSERVAQDAVTRATGSSKDGNYKNFDSLLVLRTDSCQDFFCIACGEFCIPDYARRASCGLMVCGACAPSVKHCGSDCFDRPSSKGSVGPSSNGPHPFTMSVSGTSFQKEMGEVFVRCQYFKHGCKWIGTFCEYHAAHWSKCSFWHLSIKEFQHEGQSARDLRMSTEEKAHQYGNAYFMWSWQGESIDGEPVLSNIRNQARGWCSFVSITATFEACLRLKGRKVNQLSEEILHDDYIEAITGPNALTGSKLWILATILKEKGMVELSPDGVHMKRWHISDFKFFKMDTRDGMLDALHHIHENGPIVCVYAVSGYQGLYKKSAGILQGIPSVYDVTNFYWSEKMRRRQVTTHAVCTAGLGAEDMTSFLSYQNSKGVEVQKGGYGRVLPCSVLEAVGLFIDENIERPLKRTR